MKVKTLMTAGPVLLCLALFAVDAHAIANSADVFDNVLARYAAAATMWQAYITGRASWLFWTLATISMVWTFGLLALRQADIGEFFAEFVGFTIFTGFYWWLLTNGPRFATDIMDSLRTIAGNASGTGTNLTPSGIVDIGFDIFFKVVDESSVWAPVDTVVAVILSGAILIVMALIGVNMLLLMVSGWILAYAGIFFLGFGGSRWTSEFAINYYKTVLNIGAQLFAMVLLVGIGKSFVDQYYLSMNAGINFKEMGVMLVVAVVLLALVTKVPALIGNLSAGGGAHAFGSGFGAGAALGAAISASTMARAAVATGTSAMASGVAGLAGSTQALAAATSRASQNVADGSDFMSQWGKSSSSEREEEPLRPTFTMRDPGMIEALNKRAGEQARACSAGQGGLAGSAGQKAQDSKPSPLTTAGKVAVDAAANLARGVAAVGKAHTQGKMDDMKERISQSLGGQIAAAINSQGAGEGTVGGRGEGSGAGTGENTVKGAAESTGTADSTQQQAPVEPKPRRRPPVDVSHIVLTPEQKAECEAMAYRRPPYDKPLPWRNDD